ncbi:MAG: aldehyde dehydrogenase [Spirochaetes bacterium RBG_16_49_21]|nr:MAG: aldehyde dehydrogenase [Spirochaetes bacterium RBG_16_49_21]
MNVAHRIKTNHKYTPELRQVSKETILLRSLLQKSREFFNSGKTRDIEFRLAQLKKLREAVSANKGQILKALGDDLKKPGFEAYTSEIGMLFQEIDYASAHLKQWTRHRTVGTPTALAPAKSRIVPEPYGMVLIIGPWNYPFQLTMAPLVGAIGAGNTAVVKPSELAPATSEVLAGIIGAAFDARYITVVQGGVDITHELLVEKFDYIFFTGGTEIGKIILQAASNHLTPVTLELGGKSPVIVDKDASLDMAAKKIVWGKFINAGQTCLAPDYLLVHHEVKSELLERIKRYIHEFYGDNPKQSKSYGRIVNERHFHRITRLLRSGAKIIGGRADLSQLYIEPTVIDEVTLNQPLMKEEIFGPILPVMTYRNLNDALSIVKSLPKPLALYIFSNNKKTVEQVTSGTSSGGVCVNDLVVQIGNYYLPYGGVGASGMGAYHGKASFDTFSHYKSIMIRSRFIDIPRRYPPYEKRNKGFLRRISG